MFDLGSDPRRVRSSPPGAFLVVPMGLRRVAGPPAPERKDNMSTRTSAIGWRAWTRIVVICICAVPVPALGGITVFQPTPVDLWDFDTNYYYTWGVSTGSLGGTISSVTLTIAGIDDWIQPDPDNHLYIHLLDQVAPTPQSYGNESNWVTRGVDYEDPSDQFAGQGLLLAKFTDTSPGELTLTFDLPAEYLPWLADGNFGFGFDPDCHYSNKGISLSVTTAPAPAVAIVPVPGSTGLCLFGLVLLAAPGRRWLSATA